MIPTDSNMSTGEVRRVSRQDIQLVQNLIERCLQLYMNQKEVVETLLVQAKIEPGFTELVWQKLEEENREFFKAYHVRLMVKNQIMIFNKLLEKQVELMHKMCPSGVTSVPNSNGSRSSSMVHQAPCFISEHTLPISRLENMPHPADISSTLLNGGSSTHGNMQSAGDMLLHSGRMDVSPNILPAHTLHMGVVQGVNGDLVKSEPGYADSSFAFGGDGNIMEMRTIVCDASAASFGSVENNSQALHAPLHDTDNSGIGFLGQIPRSFSLSDLTADFSQSSEILESYSRSPFLASDVDEFLDSPGRECHGENKRLDTISEGLSYEEFSSD